MEHSDASRVRRNDLAWLLQPMRLDEFFAAYWEQRPLHISGRAPDYYREVFSLDSFDHALMNGKLEAGDLIVAKEGKNIDSGDYIKSDGTADLSKLYDYHRQGYTIYLYHLDKRDAEVRRLCRNVEGVLHHRTYPAAFLSPPQAVGLNAHFDVPEIFVLQLHGEKTWRLYRPVVDKPFKNSEQVPVRPDEIGAPVLEATLRAGDLLYFPRGYVHEPFTNTVSSLHITMGLTVRVWWDVFQVGLEQMAQRMARLRDTLPRGYLTQDTTPEMRATFASLMQEFAASFDLERALRGLREDFFLSRPPPPDGHFRQLEKLDDVSADTLVERRESVICFVHGNDERAGIVFSGGKLSGPPGLEQSLRDIAERDAPFRVRDIATLLPLDSKIVLVRGLIKAGLLKVVEP